MNRILRFIYAALIVSTAVACHTSEIDNPNNDNQDKPKAYDNIILTASIKQTRVDYSINGDKLEQRWAEGDAIYGFYGGDETNKIVFTVESVDDETGVASLSPEFGWSGFLSAYKANNNLAVGLVYTGCTTSEISSDFYNYSTIEVDMTSQKTERIPACMHASTYSDRTEDDITYIQFKFDNDCSIIEVFSFTGVKEDRDEYFDGDSATLGDITVDGLIEGCKYSLYKGVLQFEPIDKTDDGDAPTKVTLGDSWSVTKDGDITYDGDIKPVFIAVVPSEYTNFTVSANLNGGKKPISQPFENKLFEKGNSYYIMANPVVAKTADNVYFKTVYDAFEHAEELSDRYTTAADNVVTLIKKEINGFGDVSEIEIDYPVTLDLNGCTLSLDGSEGFQITFNKELIPGELIITDSAPLDKDGKYVGTIDSSSINPMIHNSGTVTIDGGNLSYKFIDGETYDYSYYSMIYNSGTLSIDNASFLKSDGSPEEDGKNFYIINNDKWGTLNIIDGHLNSFDNIHSLGNVGTVTISGGTITSKECCAIVNEGNLTISDGIVYSENNEALWCRGGSDTQIGDNSGYPELYSGYPQKDDAVIYISGGASFTMLNGHVYGEKNTLCSAIYVSEETTDCSISGGKIESYDVTIENDSQKLTITGDVEISGHFALKNNEGAEAKITGGTLNSTDDSAVVNYGDLSVGDPSIDEDDRDSININSPTTYIGCPAIYCSSSTGSLNIYYGNIIGTTGAVEFKNGGQCKIFGGYFESSNDQTLSIHNGSDCTISGGIINCKGSCPAVFCYSLDSSDAISELSIIWPKSPNPEMSDQEYGESIHEPLIYAKAPYSTQSSNYSYVPISTNYPDNDGDVKNTAKVSVSGGYLISNPNVPWFFVGDGFTDYLYNIDHSSFGGFYSNQKEILTQGDSNTSYIDLENSGNGHQIMEGDDFPTFKATFQGSGSSFSMPKINVETGGLWFIAEKVD